jgi:hypothetical protein
MKENYVWHLNYYAGMLLPIERPSPFNNAANPFCTSSRAFLPCPTIASPFCGPASLLHLVRVRATASGIMHGSRIGVLKSETRICGFTSAVPSWRVRLAL